MGTLPHGRYFGEEPKPALGCWLTKETSKQYLKKKRRAVGIIEERKKWKLVYAQNRRCAGTFHAMTIDFELTFLFWLLHQH